MRLSAAFNAQNPRSHYSNLEIAPGPLATRKRIREQFQRLAKQWHPDKNQSKDAPQRFAQITESYQLLSNPERKQEYDDWMAHMERSPHSRFDIPQYGGDGGSTTWMKSSKLAEEDYFDHRAAAFEASRKSMMGNERYRQRDPKKHYQTAIHSLGAGSHASDSRRRKDEEEKERLHAERYHVEEHQTKFLTVAGVILFLLYLQKRGRDER